MAEKAANCLYTDDESISHHSEWLEGLRDNRHPDTPGWRTSIMHALLVLRGFSHREVDILQGVREAWDDGRYEEPINLGGQR
jgi:hypothetical protein